ncbi:hypothetical protein [Stenomitos frigidus]|uniref:Uncharacterized protein n=1 Tax=Stenomitos frigidus ULC18 TaxID=2107698 RepID=A0A2T1EB17_9CYAN|nr:hypothetical protein [Stenomitos frigidus]PSB29893.1 hypothetical protein C7B82_10090 [Stenomitos frigidus ULC18]
MSSLSDLDKSRARWHLGYNESVPTGDRTLMEIRMTKIADSFTVGKIRDRLDRCDRTEVETETDAQGSGIVTKRFLLGDVNRTDVNYQAESLQKRERAYMKELNALATSLGVRNWRDPELQDSRRLSETVTDPVIPAPVEITYNLTYGTDLYLYFA